MARRAARSTRRLMLAGWLVLLSSMAGCQAVMPAISALVMAFGQDMLAAASVNYAPRYAYELENLLAVLARQATGMNFQPQLQQVGYQAPPPRYMRPKREQSAGYDDYQQSTYDEETYDTTVYEDTSEQGYETPADNDPYADPYSDPYAESDAEPSSDPYADPYASTTAEISDPYQQQPTDNPYGALSTRGVGTRAREPQNASLGVALLVQRAGTQSLVPIEGGAVLRDGRGNPAAGDLLKVHFRSNCACYVYIIGVDATGMVAQIFPDPSSGQQNPVRAGTDYLIPGDEQWWALDEQRGVENLYFVSSKTQRLDLEQALAGIAAAKPATLLAAKRAVQQPAIIPPTRGMVKIRVPQVTLAAGRQQATIAPAAFVGTLDDVGVTVTRWFRHE